MKTGLAFSAAAHAALLILVLVGLNFGEPLQPEPVESISVDLVPVSEFSNIRKGTLDSTVIETDTPSAVESDKPAELAKPTGNTAEDQPTPERAPTPSPMPVRQTAPEAQPDPEPTPAPETVAPPQEAQPEAAPPEAAPPAPAEPTPEPTPTPPASETPELATDAAAPEAAAPTPAPAARTASLEQKRAEFKKQQEAKKAADAKAKADAEAKKVADAKKKAEEEAKKAAEAKKVADAKKAADAKKKADEAKKAQQAANEQADDISAIINAEPSRGGTTGEGGTPTVGKTTGQASTLSNSQIAALGAQIKQCLNVPAGAQEAGLIIKLNFSVDASGMVTGNPTPVQAPASGLEQTYVSAATRAVLRCGPYTIAAGQDVRVTFDPNEF